MESQAVMRILEKGEVKLQGQFLESSNATFFVKCLLGEEQLQAVYKPEAGQTELYDFAPDSLPRREVAAWLVCRAADWDFVPPTVYRKDRLPFGAGSLQVFIEHNPQMHYLALEENERDLFRKVALFDLVANNADRKSGHLLLGKDGRWWAIDQALCFNVEPKLRTVIWDFIGEPFSEEEKSALCKLELALEPISDLSHSLRGLLREHEIDAIRKRLLVLLEQGAFPEPDSGHRPVPWPLV
jgi:hypothetical protein